MDEHGPFVDALGEDTDLAIRAVCVRLYPEGPAIHANAAHVATGVASVRIGEDDGWLWIVHDSSHPVAAILCSPDETITARGILAGASGGTNYSRVRFTEVTPTGPVPLDLRDPAQYAKVAGSSSNLWYAVVQVRGRTLGQPSRADRLAAHHAALAARVGLLEGTVSPSHLDAAAALVAALEAELVARELGPIT